MIILKHSLYKLFFQPYEVYTVHALFHKMLSYVKVGSMYLPSFCTNILYVHSVCMLCKKYHIKYIVMIRSHISTYHTDSDTTGFLENNNMHASSCNKTHQNIVIENSIHSNRYFVHKTKKI